MKKISPKNLWFCQILGHNKGRSNQTLFRSRTSVPIYPTNANSEICEKPHKGIGVVGEHFIGVAGVNLIFNCEYYFLLGCSCVNINIVSLCSFHSVHNTIYLEVHCPAVRPHLVVVSDSGRSVVDFANVSLGKIKNILLSSWVASRKRIFLTETLFFHQSAIHQRYSVVHGNFNSQDLIFNSPLWLIHIS